MPGAAQALSLEDLAPWAAQKATELAALDLTVPFKRITVLLQAEYKACFDESRSPDGVPWAPLKHPRANNKGGDKVLRDNGLLMASGTAGGQGHIERIEARALTWGTNLHYAAVHNYGFTFHHPEQRAPTPRGKKAWVFPGPNGAPIFTRRIKAHDVVLPQRQFVGWSEHAKDTSALILGEWYEQEVAS